MSDPAWDVINELRETWCDGPCANREGCGCADAIQKAIAAEREACAKIADKVVSANAHQQGTVAQIQHDTGAHIADAIRARGQTT